MQSAACTYEQAALGTLNEAALLALEGMIDLLSTLHGMECHQALGMASALVDLRITQLVNEVKGVHALLPHGAF